MKTLVKAKIIKLKSYKLKRNLLELNNFPEKITTQSFTLKGIVMNHILSPINEYNSEPVNIGEVCVKGILL